MFSYFSIKTFVGRVNPKILYTKMSDKMEYANSADSDQTAPEQSDQVIHCLPFR